MTDQATPELCTVGIDGQVALARQHLVPITESGVLLLSVAMPEEMAMGRALELARILRVYWQQELDRCFPQHSVLVLLDLSGVTARLADAAEAEQWAAHLEEQAAMLRARLAPRVEHVPVRRPDLSFEICEHCGTATPRSGKPCPRVPPKIALRGD